MRSSALIVYATRSGSTGEVAQAIAAAMDEAGVPAEVQAVQEVATLSGKQAIILGAPLYIGRFPKEFHQFLRFHREALHGRRPWFFVVGPTRNRAEDFEAARKQAARQLSAYPWLYVKDVQVFGGRWGLQNLPFPFSLLRRIPGNPLKKIPAEDIRDWAAIRTWGMAVAQQIRTAA